jgi:hypothetical protein
VTHPDAFPAVPWTESRYDRAASLLLAALEAANAGRPEKDIRRTRFGIREVGGGAFDFYVILQTPR